MDSRKPSVQQIKKLAAEAKEYNSKQPFFTNISDDNFQNEIINHLTPGGIIHFAHTTNKGLSLFKGRENHHLSLDLLRQLLSHGALGELEAAEGLWKLFPDLLTCRGTVYHPNRIYAEGQEPVDIPIHKNPGRYKYVNQTLYQIYLRNSEFGEAERVGEHMREEKRKNQFLEVFPDGEIKKYDFDLKHAKTLLQAVFDAVAADTAIQWNRQTNSFDMSDSTRQTLDALYQYAKPKSEQKTGLVFDPEFYYEALKLYDQNYGQFERQWDRYPFWNICVEEWLAGCLGTGYLRHTSQGLGNAATRRGCVLSDDSSYFAFRRSRGSLPGSHFFVGYFGESTPVPRLSQSCVPRALWSAGRFKTCFKQRRKQGQNLRGDMQIAKRRRV